MPDPYAPIVFEPWPSTNTPITAARLNQMQTVVVEAVADANAAALSAASAQVAAEDAAALVGAPVDAVVATLLDNPGSASGQIVASAAAGATEDALRGNSITLFGHSIVANCATIDSAGAFPRSDQMGIGFFAWLQVLLRQRFGHVVVKGYPGYTATDLRPLIADAIAQNTSYIGLLLGANSYFQGHTAATIIADQDYIITQVTKAGRTAILFTDFTSTAIDTTAEKEALNAVQRWQVAQAVRPGVIVVPWHHAVTDWGTGAPLTNAMPDGTHPSSFGALTLAQAAAPILDPIIPSIGDGYLLQYNTGSIDTALANGMMAGTTGALYGGATGVVADSWSGATTAPAVATFSKVARADGRGVWQRVVISTGTNDANGAVRLTQTRTGQSAWVGATAVLEFEVEVTNGNNLGGFQADLQWLNAGGDIIALATALRNTAGPTDIYRTSFKGVVRTPPIAVPAGATTAQVVVHMNGKPGGSSSVTLDIGRARVHIA